MSDVEHYIEREMSEIPGWLSATDARIFAWISHLQGQRDLTGDILEVGVYRGKSAVLLGHLLRGPERLVLCDLFDQPVSPSGSASDPSAPADESAWYPGATLDRFLVTYGRYHAQPPVVYQCPSTELAAHENARGFRMIHIDGSHTYDVVRSDIALAATMLLPDGLVILDDYRSFHTPGVSAAIWEAVINDGLRPLWLTQDKMYASWGLDMGEVREPLQRMLHQTLGVAAVDEMVCGHDMLVALPKDYRDAAHGREGRLLKAFLPPVLATLPQRVRRRRADPEERVSTATGHSENREPRESREEDFWGHHVPSLEQCLSEYEAGPEPNTATMLDALGPVTGARVLDFACGPGVTSAWLTDRGAEVTGIDLSAMSTARAQELFDRLGKKATFVTGAAESMELPTPFDGIVGRYALHHIDCAAVAPILAGLLVTGGKAAFLETMATNPVLNLARDRAVGRFGIIRIGTLDEHPLTTKDFSALRQAFGELQIELGQMRFLRIFDRQVLRYRSPRMSAALGAVDDAVYRWAPSLKGLSYHQVLTLTKTW